MLCSFGTSTEASAPAVLFDIGIIEAANVLLLRPIDSVRADCHVKGIISPNSRTSLSLMHDISLWYPNYIHTYFNPTRKTFCNVKNC